jgi:alpha-glucosidase
MAAYTSGGDKLHMCYTFDFLGPVFNAKYFHDRIAAFEAIVGDGWPCWAFSNHDVERHVSRWAGTAGLDHDRLAVFAAALLLSLRGSVCLFEGEELGLGEARLGFADLVDPYGIRFWPEYKGRDGCRTPMVWESTASNAGFTSGRPWLPVPADHVARSVDRQTGDSSSVLSRYRGLLAFRKAHPELRDGTLAFVAAPDDVLAFVRSGEHQILCLFNFSSEEQSVAVPDGKSVETLRGHGFAASLDGDGRAVRLPPGDIFYGVLR